MCRVGPCLRRRPGRGRSAPGRGGPVGLIGGLCVSTSWVCLWDGHVGVFGGGGSTGAVFIYFLFFILYFYFALVYHPRFPRGLWLVVNTHASCKACWQKQTVHRGVCRVGLCLRCRPTRGARRPAEAGAWGLSGDSMGQPRGCASGMGM